jgi:CRISPR/Cas system CSM-associated protein Csm4 (group 5 of RAMP superfamily)
MNPALLIRLRPSTPWRLAPATGAALEASAILHSDSLYSAVSLAFEQLGLLEEWLNATASAYSEPAVRLSSAFPWQRGYLYAPPPAGLWPPIGGQGKVRWKGAALLPTSVIADLVAGNPPGEDQWIVDGPSGCLVPASSRSATGPYRFVLRSSAAVDRVTGGHVAPHAVCCVQFAPASGLWCAAQFSSQTAYAVWAPRIQAAFRLLADSGLGGLRSRGFGRSRSVDFQPGLLPELLFGAGASAARSDAWWLLSLLSPAETDDVRWAAGNYQLASRSGRVGSARGAGRLKLSSRMVAEGSVVVCGKPPVGAARNVAPEGCPHPIYRAGYAVALPIPWPVTE